MTPRWLVRGALVVVAGSIAAAACGVPSDRHYTAIQHDDIPFAIADTTTTSTTTTTLPPATTTTAPLVTTTTIPTDPVTLFYILNGHLLPVTRQLPHPVSPDQAMAALQQGPDEKDQPPGLRGAVPVGSIVGVTVAGGIATVNLAPTFVQPTTASTGQPADQPLAFGQIVLTMTSLPGIGQVKFTVARQPQEALVGDGSLTSGFPAVSADNYAGLRSTS